jgi:thioredoxin-related protein
MKLQRFFPVMLAISLLMALVAFAQPQQTAEKPRPTPRPLVDWGSDLNEAVQQAGNSQREIVVFFNSKSIPPSVAMQNEVLPSNRVRSYLQDFELVQIDVDAQPAVAGKFKITSYRFSSCWTARGRRSTDLAGSILPGRSSTRCATRPIRRSRLRPWRRG